MMSHLVSNLRQAHIHEITIYGAGDVGQSLLKIARLNQIKVAYFVDRKPSLGTEDRWSRSDLVNIGFVKKTLMFLQLAPFLLLAILSWISEQNFKMSVDRRKYLAFK